VKCFVYKGDKKPDHYLYLPEELYDVSAVDLPAALLTMLGELSLVLEFNLGSGRKLAQADAEHVLNDIRDQGFYLQMPKKDMVAEENAWFN